MCMGDIPVAIQNNLQIETLQYLAPKHLDPFYPQNICR